MTVCELRILLNDPLLSDHSEVRIGTKESLHGCDCSCCSEEEDIGILDGVIGCQIGLKRALVLMPVEHLYTAVPAGYERIVAEGDE